MTLRPWRPRDSSSPDMVKYCGKEEMLLPTLVNRLYCPLSCTGPCRGYRKVPPRQERSGMECMTRYLSQVSDIPGGKRKGKQFAVIHGTDQIEAL